VLRSQSIVPALSLALVAAAFVSPATVLAHSGGRPAVSRAAPAAQEISAGGRSLASEYVLVGARNDRVGRSPAAADHDSLCAVNTVTRPQGNHDADCTPTAAQQRKIDSLIAAARRIRPPRRDSSFNGADDDGSGTVVLLECAEQFAAEKPARLIRFATRKDRPAIAGADPAYPQ